MPRVNYSTRSRVAQCLKLYINLKKYTQLCHVSMEHLKDEVKYMDQLLQVQVPTCTCSTSVHGVVTVIVNTIHNYDINKHQLFKSVICDLALFCSALTINYFKIICKWTQKVPDPCCDCNFLHFKCLIFRCDQVKYTDQP